MTSVQYGEFCNNVSICIRQDDDRRPDRMKSTASSETIARNLDRLMLDWSPLLQKEAKKQIRALKKHALKSCLSGIPVNCGTFR